MNFKSKNETLTQVYLRIMKELTNPKRNVLALSISYKKEPERIICHIYDLVDIEQDRCQQVDFIFSTDSNYYVVREGDDTFSPDDIPSTACSIDLDIDDADEIVALELVYRTYEINFDYAIYELLEDMIEMSMANYPSMYKELLNIGSSDLPNILEYEDIDLGAIYDNVCSNTSTITFRKDITNKVVVDIATRITDMVRPCEKYTTGLKVRVAIGYLYAKYFLEADTSNGFGCVYYPDSKTLGVERSLFTLDRE